MKAAVCTAYGPPQMLVIEEMERPVPRAGEILVQSRAASVTSGDARVRGMRVPKGFGLLGRLGLGLTRPRRRVLGTETAGVIAALGEGVTQWTHGDRVFVFDGTRMGGYAEYRRVRADGPVVAIPDALTFEEAAALSFGGTTALDFLKAKAGIASGERVLIVGASGAVGTAAVQLARHFGAHVTGVCSGRNADFMRSLGADAVVDYAREDVRLRGERYDIVLDMTGGLTVADAPLLLAPNGRLILAVASLGDMLRAGKRGGDGRRVIAGPVAERAEDMRFLAELAASGAYRVVIDRVFAFEEIVAAHRLVDEGRKRGNVVVVFGA